MPLAYRGMGNFLLNIIWSPVQLLLVMLPWTLLIWMPFCAAIRPLDKTPIFSHYFRVIFITDFLFTLLNPLSTMDDFMFTLPPLALLCAITYDTAVRRYSVEMRHLILICGYIPAILAAVLMIYCFFDSIYFSNEIFISTSLYGVFSMVTFSLLIGGRSLITGECEGCVETRFNENFSKSIDKS